MASKRYLNFDLLLEQEGDGLYHARVTSSPLADLPSVRFRLPFDAKSLEILLLKLDPGRTGTRGGPDDAVRQQAAKDFGGPLFDAIFDGDLGLSWTRSMDRARAEGAGGLRLRLRMDDAPALSGLPWEMLYDARRRTFPAQSEQTPIVRFLDVNDDAEPIQVDGPLRVLAVISSPLGLEELDVEREWTRISQALGDKVRDGLVVVDRLPTATVNGLGEWLLRHDTHVIHFVGHGDFDSVSREGFLYFQDDHGGQDRVSASVLGPFIHDHEPLRMVVMNACRSARTSPDDPYGGMAQGLVQQGANAVVAMQFPISDPAAVRFTGDFYGALAAGLPVDQAVGYARKSLWAKFRGEWATPVLFMRSPDGNIFGSVHAPDGWVVPPVEELSPAGPQPAAASPRDPVITTPPVPVDASEAARVVVPSSEQAAGAADVTGWIRANVGLIAAAAVILLLVIAVPVVVQQIRGGSPDSSGNGDATPTDSPATDPTPSDSAPTEPTEPSTPDSGASTAGLADTEMLVAAGTDTTTLGIYRVDEITGRTERLTEEGVKSWLPVLSPDRRTMVYLRRIGDTEQFELYQGSALARDPSSQRPFLAAGTCDDVSRPAWSPTTGNLVFRCRKGEVVTLVQVGQDGGQPEVLLTMGTGDADLIVWMGDPTISADGSTLVFFGNSAKTPTGRFRPDGVLYRYEFATGEVSILLGQAGRQSYFSDPVFSPDGHWLAWRTNLTPGATPPNFEVYAATYSSTSGLGDRKQISDGGAATDQDPSFSNDNQRIAYASWTSSTQQQIIVAPIAAPEQGHPLESLLPSFQTVPAWGTGR